MPGKMSNEFLSTPPLASSAVSWVVSLLALSDATRGNQCRSAGCLGAGYCLDCRRAAPSNAVADACDARRHVIASAAAAK